MIKLLVIVGFIVLVALFPFIRSVVTHPYSTIKYLILDPYHYIRDRYYNRCESGVIDMYCGLFGSGKTVSAVQRVVGNYKRYNGKLIRLKGKLVPVKINILSNVDLQGIPFTPLTSLQQLVDWTHYAPEHRNEWLLCLIDEASVLLNSRSFASNLDFGSINSFLCSRHFNMACYLTSQRFMLTDKLLRQVTQHVFQCRKLWRVIVHNIYDAYELENCSNPLEVKPMRRASIFCTDKVFGCYDTLATVKDIVKKTETGDILPESEILEKIGDTTPVRLPDRKLLRKYRDKPTV